MPKKEIELTSDEGNALIEMGTTAESIVKGIAQLHIDQQVESKWAGLSKKDKKDKVKDVVA